MFLQIPSFAKVFTPFSLIKRVLEYKFIFLFCFLFLLSETAFSQNTKKLKKALSIINKETSFEENLDNCKKLIGEHCGSKSNQECLKQVSPKSAQVAECMAYMMKNPKKGMTDGLHQSFQSVYDNVLNKKDDMGKCIKMAQTVCKNGESLETCLMKNPGALPSFCRDLIDDTVQEMNSLYKNNPQATGCADSLMKQCPLDLSNEKDSDALSGRKIQAYQKCVAEKIRQTPGCENLIKSQLKN